MTRMRPECRYFHCRRRWQSRGSPPSIEPPALVPADPSFPPVEASNPLPPEPLPPSPWAPASLRAPVGGVPESSRAPSVPRSPVEFGSDASWGALTIVRGVRCAAGCRSVAKVRSDEFGAANEARNTVVESRLPPGLRCSGRGSGRRLDRMAMRYPLSAC